MEIIYRILMITGLLVGSVSAQTVYYSENFEGTVGMTQSGGWGFGVPTNVGPSAAYEGSRCAGTVLNGNYSLNTEYILTTPSISLPNTSTIKLSFNEWYSTESSFDYIYLEIEQNGSGTWNSLRTQASGANSSWNMRSYDLSSYKNSSIKIRFRLNSDNVNASYPGWYIDQVQVFSPVTKSLTVNSSGNGATSPNGTVSIETNIPYSISATPNPGYRFSKWTVKSGSATFVDSSAQSTSVQITNDAVIAASFIAGTVYPITSTPSRFNFTTDNYEIDPSNGVRLKFTAPSAGTYKIVIDSSYKSLYYYGTSSTFSSSVGSVTYYSSRITYTFTAASGENHYFIVTPSSTSYYTTNFYASVKANATLTLTTSGSGTVSPSSPTSITSELPYSIYAYPSSGYRFLKWTVQSGSATFADSNLQSTTVQIYGNATVRANFVPGTVYPITSTATSYNYTTNYYDVSQSNGVRFKFTAPATGGYAVTIQNAVSHNNQFYYYGRDSLLTSYLDYKYNSSSSSISFYANAGETYWFRVIPTSTSYYTYDFSISYTNALTMTISNGGHGATTPSGSIAVISGESKTITATPSSGYRFSNWSIVSGSPTITSSTAMSTTVSVTDKAEIKANFVAGTVYPITSTATSYNYTTNYYDVSQSNGVRFKFTAPAAGGYAVTVQNAVSHYNYLYYYGRDSLLTSYVDYKYSSSSSSISFYANAGETYWFRVVPASTSYYTYDFNISYTNAPTLKISNDGHGSTTPSVAIAVMSGESKTITATPSPGYRFSNWSIVSGTPTITSSTAISTTVSTTADAEIKANFVPGTVYPITSTATSYNYTTNYYDVSPLNGVRFKFTAPAAGGYAVTIQNVKSHSNTFYYYGIDSLFNSPVESRSNSTSSSISFYANAGETHWFKVVPGSTSYNAYDFDISYINALTLTISNDGHGSTAPSGKIAILSGESKTISAISSSIYRFSNWTTVSGSPTISSSTAMSITVSTTGNAEIKANFVLGNIYSINSTPTTYNFTTNSFEVSPDSGGRFKFIPPNTGNFVVDLKNVDSSSLHFYDYGTDSTFRSILNDQRSTGWNLQYTFTAAAGEVHYFRVSPSSNSYWSKNFVLFWAPGISLDPDSVSAVLTAGGTLNEHKHLHLPADIAPPKADIVICMDLTGSMGGALSNVKTNAVAIMNQIRGIIPDTRFGAISHMDYPFSPYGGSSDYPYKLNSPLSDSVALVSNAISAMALGSGGDGPESYSRVLYETYSDTAIHWRQGAKRFVLLWGDYLPHDSTCILDCSGLSSQNTGVDPGRDGVLNTTDDLKLGNVIAGMSSNNVTLIAIHNGSFNNYWNCYAQKTGGNSFPINTDGTVPGGTDIATYLAGLIQQNVKHIDTLTLKVCTPGYESWLSSVTPKFYTDMNLDSAKDFDFDITIRVPGSVTSGIHNFEVCAVGDGVEYISQKVQISLPNSNHAPKANAGSDQMLYNTRSSCSVTATLNGSGSSDPDGDLLTYSWTGPFTGALSGVNPTVNLPVGTNQIYLMVRDPDGLSDTDTVSITVADTIGLVFDSIGYQKVAEQQPFSLDVRVRYCNGPIPQIKIINAPSGASFEDNHDGHGTFTWTPGGNDNGYYVIIFETGDGTTTVRDTIVIEVTDVNCYKPVLELSSTSATTSVHLPVTILAKSSDLDGIPPLLRTSALPTGAHFSTDDNGAGVFTWTPSDTGRYTFTISALDITDTTVKVDSTITIIVNDNNVTGPVFTHRNDTTINQNSEIVLHIEAHDPDGTIPSLFLISGPSGLQVVDNKDCTGTIAWAPDCETSGMFSVKVGAADQFLSDTLTLSINVRDVNCAPVLNHIPDVNAKPGELVRIQVSAFDPDNDGTIPTLSAVCNSISGYTFVTTGNAVAEFKCVAPGSQGIYPVTFYASDGFLIDSVKMFISINEFGYVKISCKQKGAGIFTMPAGSYSGISLGIDSITYKAPLGTYWFEVRADGYRSRRISCDVELNDTISKIVDLKPSIPLMLTSPETLSLGSGVTLPQSGSISFVDLNGDGIEDLTVASINGGAFYSGLDSINNRSYHSQPSGFGNLAAGLKPLHHAFIDWNNDGLYECVLSDMSGNIAVVKQNGSIDTLIKISGGKPYSIVYDIDKDGKKDLLVNSEDHGLFKYINNGTDAVPAFRFADECTDQSGHSLTDLKGAPVLFDLDNDNREEMVILSSGVLKVFKVDSSFSELTCKEDLNCVGKRVAADSLSMALIGPSLGAPKLAIYIDDKILIYPTRLLGDVNHDSVVNILDISKISRQMDYSESDPGYTPAYNLRLSDTGEEIINIRDISRASKCFDMKE